MVCIFWIDSTERNGEEHDVGLSTSPNSISNTNSLERGEIWLPKFLEYPLNLFILRIINFLLVSTERIKEGHVGLSTSVRSVSNTNAPERGEIKWPV